MNDRLRKKLWHTNRKEFIKEFSILQTVNSEGNFEHTYFERNPKSLELERLSTCQIKEVQCTGLKDKNGKLIYEGDIIAFMNPYENDKLMAIIVNWESTPIVTGFNFGEEYAKGVEIIGNKFETPELLKECENE